jgi:hypothetical protein
VPELGRDITGDLDLSELHEQRSYPFQAWTVAETLDAWTELAGGLGLRSR